MPQALDLTQFNHYAALDARLGAIETSGIPNYAFDGIRSMFDGDLVTGSGSWTISNHDSATFTPAGLVLTRTTSGAMFPVLRMFQDVPGAGLNLVAGNRYAVYADLSLSADQGVSAVATVLWRAFVLSSAVSEALPGVRLAVGSIAEPRDHQAAYTFIAGETATEGNPYTDISDPEDAGSQNLLTVDLRVTYRAFMVVDLGPAGSAGYAIPEADVARVIAGFGAPFASQPVGASHSASFAGRAARADVATQADLATQAGTADMAEVLRSPFEGKRVLTLGHSLVSQVVWQPKLLPLLALEGYSFKGIAGGTLQPKPGEGVSGMFSRAYMTDMLATIINPNDADAGGTTTLGLTTAIKNRSVATIFWLGANDTVTDLANAPRQTLALDGAFVATLAGRAAAISTGDFADTSAGLAGTSVGQYFTTDGAAGFKILWEHRPGDVAAQVYHIPQPGTAYSTDRVMTVAEQDEFEARNTADGAAAFLSEPLTTGLIVTYETLWHTMIFNYLSATGLDAVPGHRFFIVREPQAFWRYDGTLDWPQGHFEKNEVHRRVADRWGFPLIDLWAESGINFATRGHFLQNESSGQLFIHHTQKGGLQCASVVAQRMLAFPPLDFTGLTGTHVALATAAGDLGPWNTDNIVEAG